MNPKTLRHQFERLYPDITLDIQEHDRHFLVCFIHPITKTLICTQEIPKNPPPKRISPRIYYRKKKCKSKP